VQGTYETFAAAGRQHFGGTAGRGAGPHRGPRRHGRRAAARGHDERGVCLAVEVDPAPRAAAPRDPLPRRGRTHDLDEALARCCRAKAARGEAWSVGLVGNAPRSSPSSAPRRPPRLRHRPDLAHDPLWATCPGMTLDEAAALRASRPRGVHDRAREAMAPRARRWSSCRPRRVRLRLRQQPPRRGRGGRGDRRLRVPGLRAGVHPAAVLRGQGAVPLGGALGRPKDIAVTDRAVLEPVPRQRRRLPLDPRRAASASPSRACRRASAGSATASAREGRACASTTSCAPGAR
jgi:urocanate hydratase